MKFEDKTLYLEGELTIKTVNSLIKEYRNFSGQDVGVIDLGAVVKTDSAGIAFIDTIITENDSPEIVGISKELEYTHKTFSSVALETEQQIVKKNIFVRLGEFIYDLILASKNALYIIADIFFWSFIGIYNRKGQRKESVFHQILLIGVNAVGIIGLLSFILGLILALQSAAQLRQFGANIFVADLMAVSMVTEMGPLLTAIILAGRSGSAIASEIATMKVTEELDALKMMAINPIRYVVVPKFHAITICIPLLVISSIIIGIFGGLIVAVTYLDLSAVAFITRVFEVVKFRDAIIGLGKSFFFAWTIVIIGSYYGFTVEGGAEGVGKVTTKAVVASIFWVIILDALNSIIFYF